MFSVGRWADCKGVSRAERLICARVEAFVSSAQATRKKLGAWHKRLYNHRSGHASSTAAAVSGVSTIRSAVVFCHVQHAQAEETSSECERA